MGKQTIEIMPYIYINKQTKEARIFGSITSLSNAIGIKPDNLYTTFSRKKLKEFENESYRIVKTKIEREKLNNNKKNDYGKV